MFAAERGLIYDVNILIEKQINFIFFFQFKWKCSSDWFKFSTQISKRLGQYFLRYFFVHLSWTILQLSIQILYNIIFELPRQWLHCSFSYYYLLIVLNASISVSFLWQRIPEEVFTLSAQTRNKYFFFSNIFIWKRKRTTVQL